MAEFLCKNPLKIDLFPEPLDLSLLNAEDLSSRKNSKIPSALTIEKVFTPEECQQLINLSEKSKYEPALVNIGHGQQKLMTDVRDSSRYIRDDSELSLKFGAELNPLYPQFGKKFGAHYDGSYERPDGSERSCVSVELYLNESFEGGETSFMSFGFHSKVVKVVPRTGMILIFEHSLLNEGSVVRQGRKYVIRTDVMYKI